MMCSELTVHCGFSSEPPFTTRLTVSVVDRTQELPDSEINAQF